MPVQPTPNHFEAELSRSQRLLPSTIFDKLQIYFCTTTTFGAASAPTISALPPPPTDRPASASSASSPVPILSIADPFNGSLGRLTQKAIS